MVLRNFRLNIVLRVGLILLLVLGLVVMLVNTPWRITPTVCALLIVFCVWNLIYYVEATNRTLRGFLDSIYYQDFASKTRTSHTGPGFQQLDDAYRLITDSFRRIVYQKEEHLGLLEAIIDHVQVAILCVSENGKIKLFNKTARRLFKVPYMHHISGLARVDRFIFDSVQKLVANEHQLIAANIKGNMVNLSVVNNEFRVGGRQYHLLSFHNIHDELEQKESDAWQKLIQVFAHEIMNSATPILSLSTSIKNMLTDKHTADLSLSSLTDEDRRDLVQSLASIQSRSTGLIRFVDAYRGLTQIPMPKQMLIDLRPVVQNVAQALTPEITAIHAQLETRFDAGSLQVKIDPQQIEQALINLLHNAIQALEGKSDGKIIISVTKQPYSKIHVDVEDNGLGIASENMANIFMPFYTTKQKGTGVGLSISRQIMFMNRGLLTVDSTEGKGSRFRLEFSAAS